MASAYHCVECGAYCNGRDPHPGEVDELCRTDWEIREGLRAWRWTW